ncbi:hypothetical protein H5T88_07895 [bacterium]|nr:hypothetical protein [bacterium]
MSLISKLVLRKADGKSAFNVLGGKRLRKMEDGGWREIGTVKKTMSRFSFKEFQSLRIAPSKFSAVDKIYNFSFSYLFSFPQREKGEWIGAMSNLRKPLFRFVLGNPNIIRNLVPQMREISISSIKPQKEFSITVPSLFSSQYIEEDVFSSLLKSLRKQLGF